MAKDIKFKISFNGQELDAAKLSLEQVGTLTAQLRQKLEQLPMGSKEFKKVQKEIEGIEKASQKARDAGKGWLDSIASAPGPVGLLGQSIQGVQKAFGSFNMALKTSLVGFVAAAVVELVNQFRKMEGVMDPINKITSVFSGLMSQLANTVLPLVVKPLEAVAFLLGKVGNLFGGAGDELSDLAERQDALSDSVADYELQQSKANRALAEAREKAADSTLSTIERKKAVEDAAKLERQIAAEGKARALEQARITAGQLATTLGYNQKQLDAIKKYDAAQLESFTKEIMQRKGLNQEQRTQLLQQLQAIQEIDANTAKIGKKTASQIKSIDNEAAQAAKEAAQKRLDAQKKELDAKITLETNSNATSAESLRKLLEEKDKLENQGTKKSKAELEVQKQNREKAIQDALKADKDYYKAQADLQDKAEKEQVDKIQTTSDDVVSAKQVELERIKILYGEQSQAFKDLQAEILAIQIKAVQDQLAIMQGRVESGEMLTEEEWKQYDKLGIKLGQLTNQVLANAATQKMTAEQKNEFVKKTQKDMDDWELQQSGTTLERSLEILNARDADIETRRLADIAKAEEKAKAEGDTEEQKNARIAAINLQAAKDTKANEDAKQAVKDKAFAQDMARLQSTANALNSLAELVGKETAAGKALAIAAATINTYKGASEVIAAKPSLPEPANTIMKVINVATTIATGLKNVREILAVKVPTTEVPEVRIRQSARGGVLDGPLHQMGGIMTGFGELEGGEYVINRASTMMFRPQLDAINALGGGDVNYQAQGFAPNAGGNGEPPIFKTYVVASEMSSQQELDRVIKDRSKF